MSEYEETVTIMVTPQVLVEVTYTDKTDEKAALKQIWCAIEEAADTIKKRMEHARNNPKRPSPVREGHSGVDAAGVQDKVIETAERWGAGPLRYLES